jgi:hypothetical protein
VGRPPPSAIELRIHGVGGASPEGLLGERHPDAVVELKRGHRTGLWARRRDPTVRGYVWGGLTAGAKLQPLWVVLLPFTLVNAAGWMHPPLTDNPRRERQVRDIQGLVTVLGYTLTATWCLWLAVVVADLLVYQAGRNLSGLDNAACVSLLIVGGVIAASGAGWRWAPLIGVGVATMGGAVIARFVDRDLFRAVGGVVLAELIMVGLAFIAGISRRRYEQHIPPGVAVVAVGEQRPSDPPDLRSPQFFARPDMSGRLLVRHLVLIGVVTAVLAVRAAVRATDGADTLGFGSSVIVLGAAQFVLVALLAVRSLGEFDRLRRRWRVAGPAVAVGLAISLTTAVFSGLTLWLSDRFKDVPVRTGAELALVDIFSANVLLVAAVIALAWLPYFLAARAPSAAADSPGPEARWSGSRFVRQRLARTFRHLDIVASAGVGFLVVASLVATVTRIDAHGSLWPGNWSLDVDGGLGPLRSASAWLLPFVVPGVGALIRLGARSARRRGTIGNLWDVLGLWPRHFHPLAVRPYCERAVPELQAHVRDVLNSGDSLVVSAHSQGSVLAFAALSGLDAGADLQRVALVTYGSPLARLHARFFPHYVGPDEFRSLRARLFSWRNFYRRTDHIGQALFEEVPEAAGDDVELPDPAEGDLRLDPVATADGPCLEADRTPWSEIAGHNLYLREPAVKRWVAEVKAKLEG